MKLLSLLILLPVLLAAPAPTPHAYNPFFPTSKHSGYILPAKRGLSSRTEAQRTNPEFFKKRDRSKVDSAKRGVVTKVVKRATGTCIASTTTAFVTSVVTVTPNSSPISVLGSDSAVTLSATKSLDVTQSSDSSYVTVLATASATDSSSQMAWSTASNSDLASFVDPSSSSWSSSDVTSASKSSMSSVYASSSTYVASESASIAQSLPADASPTVSSAEMSASASVSTTLSSSSTASSTSSSLPIFDKGKQSKTKTMGATSTTAVSTNQVFQSTMSSRGVALSDKVTFTSSVRSSSQATSSSTSAAVDSTFHSSTVPSTTSHSSASSLVSSSFSFPPSATSSTSKSASLTSTSTSTSLSTSSVASSTITSAAVATSSAVSADPDGDGPFYGEGTWYYQYNTAGACGNVNPDSAYIVAVSALLFDNWPGYNGLNPNNNPICGHQVNLTWEGTSITATVADRCPGCELRHLDLSRGAFGALSNYDYDIGVFSTTIDGQSYNQDLEWSWLN
ncbi:hypothetical protein I305_04582 [Cryptococcus gattii E566]|uniref:RlpA-like protein double-psi beta-barrel domain-containing protein n=2 Tax=Cryptococcus gattii TaxID=37769 RepID=E6RFG8_CRYGW|nr:uncharacterized protein CGB_M3150C [Cryptococcus gattii WM276]ADV25612.1 Conserved hypothetical protein [Cryptococcus gattii WM276]KIR78831.1 hypothetical protein I306_04193 [Cryptococcus gattii EJB2]KIY32829.1 hypothetical protein I305_04582 [Cryptococcus gattii E566]KJE05107.1 hypothetical protein I311_01200 [Cryptococcus gattii NT-10]